MISLEQRDFIGKGAFASVVRAYNTENPNEDIVAKIISCDKAYMNKTLITELKALSDMPEHPNLVNYKKVKISSNNN